MNTNTAVAFYSNLLCFREINEKFGLKVDFLVMTSNYNFNVDLITFKLQKRCIHLQRECKLIRFREVLEELEIDFCKFG